MEYKLRLLIKWYGTMFGSLHSDQLTLIFDVVDVTGSTAIMSINIINFLALSRHHILHDVPYGNVDNVFIYVITLFTFYLCFIYFITILYYFFVFYLPKYYLHTLSPIVGTVVEGLGRSLAVFTLESRSHSSQEVRHACCSGNDSYAKFMRVRTTLIRLSNFRGQWAKILDIYHNNCGSVIVSTKGVINKPVCNFAQRK